MEKTIGNYTSQPNRDFPLDCETLESLAGNQAMAEILGNICGDKTILIGCELNAAGTIRSEGYVFLRTQDYRHGEVLHWIGGPAGDVHVENTDVSVTADGYQYPKAYTTRRLAPGVGAEHYSWDDFKELSTNQELARKVTALETELANAVREPIGVIKMWAGTTPPANYLMCDGGAIPNEEQYATLRSFVGSNTPDLRGRFIVGYDGTDPDYDSIGNMGGDKKTQLDVDDIPAHRHNFLGDDSNGKENDYSEFLQENDINLVKNSEDGNYGPGGTSGKAGIYETSESGKGNAHENRPPYYVLAYIIKAI